MEDEKCTCNECEHETHPCPFQEEINEDSETLCDCCDYCIGECSEAT